MKPTFFSFKAARPRLAKSFLSTISRLLQSDNLLILEDYFCYEMRFSFLRKAIPFYLFNLNSLNIWFNFLKSFTEHCTYDAQIGVDSSFYLVEKLERIHHYWFHTYLSRWLLAHEQCKMSDTQTWHILESM